MRVVGVDGYGGPEALRVFELPDRHAGPGEVRLAVHAAAVNPTDTFTRNGSRDQMLKEFDPPYVAGMDVAGVVDEVGPDADTDLAVGDRVMAIVVPSGQHGGYSDSLVLPARSVARVPAGAKLVEASTLPMNGLTARRALDMLALAPGATIAVTGAAGAFGGYVVQLAKADGLRVVADASERDEQLVRDLGADVVVRRGDDVAARIREVVPEGVDALADGAIQNGLVLAAVRDGGGIAALRPIAFETERAITIHMVSVREYKLEQEKLDTLRQQVEDGVITLRVAATYPPEQASEAQARLEQGGTRGRLVIQFRDEP
ncbi:MAG: NADP-dependent oxidoreductase [Ilumatobacteraceae bacterium]